MFLQLVYFVLEHFDVYLSFAYLVVELSPSNPVHHSLLQLRVNLHLDIFVGDDTRLLDRGERSRGWTRQTCRFAAAWAMAFE